MVHLQQKHSNYIKSMQMQKLTKLTANNYQETQFPLFATYPTGKAKSGLLPLTNP